MSGSELNLFKTAKRGKIVAILPLSVAGPHRRHAKQAAWPGFLEVRL
jgi:hypothetical protein